jgi:hypothetical protein
MKITYKTVDTFEIRLSLLIDMRKNSLCIIGPPLMRFPFLFLLTNTVHYPQKKKNKYGTCTSRNWHIGHFAAAQHSGPQAAVSSVNSNSVRNPGVAPARHIRPPRVAPLRRAPHPLLAAAPAKIRRHSKRQSASCMENANQSRAVDLII